MTLLHSAARLNNEGTRCLMAGDENGAFTAFKAALEKISHGDRSRLEDEPVVTPLCSPRPPSSAPLLYPSRQSIFGKGHHSCKYRHSTLSATSTDGTSLQIPAANNNDPFLYGEAFLFREGQWLTPSDAPYCSAVIIYNMALAFHQRKRADSSSSSMDEDDGDTTLDKALFLYTISLRHIQAAASDVYSYSDVVVAAVNNQAHIYYKQKELETGRTALGELWALLREVQGKQLHVTSAFDSSDMDGFVQNVLLLLHASTLAPAA